MYKSVADEYDKEFHKKYNSDLDSSLIFVRRKRARCPIFRPIISQAGLFSAVDSAFIVQIQPQIQPHGTFPLTVVAQSLLYISLCTTLLAALITVLGKQWLMYYSMAGERGTLEARGLERQRKFDNIRQWKLEIIMQTCPLLLQVGLLLFLTAQSVYLWNIHRSIAIILLAVTSVGFASRIFLLISAMVSPNSPFQAPLAQLLVRMISTAKAIDNWMYVRPLGPFSLTRSASLAIGFLPPKPKQKQPLGRRILGTPSPEIPAIVWVLETSTDPGQIRMAAELATQVQWPLNLDITTQITRLRDIFCASFEFDKVITSIKSVPPEAYFKISKNGMGIGVTPSSTTITRAYRLKSVREGMMVHAIHCGRAFGALTLLHTSGNQLPQHNIQLHPAHNIQPPELLNIVQILTGLPILLVDSQAPTAIKWGLRVYPSLSSCSLENLLHQLQPDKILSLDSSSFADYLVAINCCLSLMNTEDKDVLSWSDKR
jgi:hypothetical protein